MSRKVTLVTAFIPSNSSRQDRKLVQYMELGSKLLTVPINKIFFTTQEIIDEYKLESNEHTQIVCIKLDNYLYQNRDKITQFELTTTNPDKDTLDYMIIMCSKTEYITKAIELNPYQSRDFVWVDFGIRHVFKCSDEEYQTKILRLHDKSYQGIRIASIWPLSADVSGYMDIYRQIHWFFAGGVFGGDRESLLEFANRMREKCLEIISTRKSLMWEVNIWRMIYLNNPKLFLPYKCDHDMTIIDNY